MFLEASGLLTGGFVVLPLLVAAGFVMACEWAGRRLGQAATERRRRTVRLAAAVLAWLSVTAGVLGCWLARGRVPRWVVAVWNFFGLALLVNIVAIAVVSTPLFRWFGDERLNVFVTYPPFVWLPGVLVMAALIGHILVWRRLTGSEGR